MFKSRDSQIGHSVANGSPPLQRFFERSWMLCRQLAQRREYGPRKLVTARVGEYNESFGLTYKIECGDWVR